MIYAYENPYADWEAYEADREEKDMDALHCDDCGEIIHEEWYDIDGVIFCPECMERRRHVI